MRNHVGQHILASQRDMSEGPHIIQEVGVEPCGFCGQDGCATQLTTRTAGSTITHSITSNCPFRHERMMYKAACISSDSAPCTNVPIHCQLCAPSISGVPKTIWKYNAVYHLIAAHAIDNTWPDIPPQMMLDMFISRKEEIKMGIDEEMTMDWRQEHGIPGSDAIELLEAELNRDSDSESDEEPGPARPSKRQRTGTVTTSKIINQVRYSK